MTTTAPEVVFGGCLWPLDPGCLGDDWEVLPASVRNRAHALASATLSRLTGRRVGGCPVTVRPVPKRNACFVPYTNSNPGPFAVGMNTAGHWVNSCFTCERDICEVALPAPIGRVDAVKIDGAVIPATDYTVHNHRFLVWMGTGPCPFPETQDLNKPDTQPGTFSVTYLNAYPVDSTGAYAAGVLAAEFAKACNGNKCRLPIGVTSVVRQGITLEVASGAFPNGLTGIREVDAYIGLWNPKGRTQAATVWFPGMDQYRH